MNLGEISLASEKAQSQRLRYLRELPGRKGHRRGARPGKPGQGRVQDRMAEGWTPS